MDDYEKLDQIGVKSKEKLNTIENKNQKKLAPKELESEDKLDLEELENKDITESLKISSKHKVNQKEIKSDKKEEPLNVFTKNESEESQDSRDESSRHIESEENIEDTNPFLDTMGQPIIQEGNIADENIVNPFLEEVVDEKATSVVDVHVENSEKPTVQVVDGKATSITDANVENSENPTVQVVDVHDVEVERIQNINKEDWVVVEENADVTTEIKVSDNNIDDNKTCEDPNPLKEGSGDESSGQPLTENLHTEKVENDSKETSPLLVQSGNNEGTIEVKKDEESPEEPKNSNILAKTVTIASK